MKKNMIDYGHVDSWDGYECSGWLLNSSTKKVHLVFDTGHEEIVDVDIYY